MTLTLRGYQPSDFETLYAIDRACFAPGIAYTRRMLREFLEQPGADCLVAVSDEGDNAVSDDKSVAVSGERVKAAVSDDKDKDAAIAGFVIAESEDDEGHIVTLDIAEAARRKGIGTALLEGIEKRLAKRGVASMVLETATANAPAVAFWQRHGYRSFRVIRGYYLGRQDAYQMRKILGT